MVSSTHSQYAIKAPDGAKVQASVVVTPEVKAYLGTCENQSETVEKAVRQSRGFKQWKAKGK